MRMLVLGAGLQGSSCAFDLLRSDGVERVVLADVRPDRLPPYLKAVAGDPRLELLALDARDRDAVLAAMGRADACMCALPYHFNLEMAGLAVEAGVHYADLGGNTEIVFRQLELDAAARDRGVSVIPDCGLAPGMSNILAAAAIGELDTAEDVRIRVGGLPQRPRPPLNYHIVYSLEGVLDYYTTPCWVIRDGRRQSVEALSEEERLEFPEPLGALEAFHTAGGLSTLPWAYEGRLRSLEYKTLRYPGHAAIMRAIRDLGLLELAPVQVRGADVVPRDVFRACAEPRLRPPPGARDLVALRVEASGRRDGAHHHVVYDLVDVFDEATGVTAMERTTGFSLSITGQLQAMGGIDTVGVCTPDRCVPPDRYMSALAGRGIAIRKRFPDQDRARPS
jgi:lysine 6-dehydrogenase